MSKKKKKNPGKFQFFTLRSFQISANDIADSDRYRKVMKEFVLGN